MTSTIVITVIVLPSVLLHIVQAQGDQQPTAATTQIITNCCDLGFRQSTFSEIVNKPKQYKMKNMCGNILSTITNVYCDTVTAGGGWLVIQRRINGSVDFNRYWSEYEEGFGNLPDDDKDTTREFWIGLRSLHCLTNQGQWELRIDYMFPNKTKGYLLYHHFRVGPASDDYRLGISGFSGNTSDPITPGVGHNLNGMRFTTRDRDNDNWYNNCAVHHAGGNAGGWWYDACSHINLNQQYNNRHSAYLNGQWHYLPFIETKIRPLNCNL